MSENTVYILNNTSSAELEVKKSVFLACAQPIMKMDEVKPIIQALRKEHHKARHVVWAYIIGDKQETVGMSDDGEPSGTAGRPILSMLQKEGYTHILVTVVRYFGGTKLGTGGLVRAYTEAAKAALAEQPKRELIHTRQFTLELPYELHKTVGKLIEQYAAQILDTQYDSQVHIQCEIKESDATGFQADLIDRTQDRITIHE